MKGKNKGDRSHETAEKDLRFHINYHSGVRRTVPGNRFAAGNNKIYSDLTLLTSTNPEVVYTSAPTADYTATLIADSNFGVTLPDSIVVQKIRFNQFVNSTYQRNVDYTYDENTGAIVIPVATIAGIVYEGSDYDIRIRAGGIPSGRTWYPWV